MFQGDTDNALDIACHIAKQIAKRRVRERSEPERAMLLA